jgi:hypothetical protein
MEGPASWGPSVPALLLSMDATVDMLYAKSTVGLSSMALAVFPVQMLARQLHYFPQTFLPGCDGHVMEQNLKASRAPCQTPSVLTTFMLAGACLFLEYFFKGFRTESFLVSLLLICFV